MKKLSEMTDKELMALTEKVQVALLAVYPEGKFVCIMADVDDDVIPMTNLDVKDAITVIDAAKSLYLDIPE